MEDFFLTQMKSLNDQNMFKSAEFIGCYVYGPESSPALTIEYANSLFGLKEYKRALNLFNNALDSLKKDSANQQPLLAQIKHKLAKCCLELRNSKTALVILKTIPTQFQTLESLMLLGNLALELDSKRQAAVYFKEVIKRSPYCIEAIQALSECGGPLETLPKNAHTEYLQAIVAAAQDNGRGLQKPTAIEVQPGHTKVLTNLKTIKMKAVREFQAGDHDSAFQLFTKIRETDRMFTDDMDIYGYLLKQKGQLGELGKLIHDMLRTNPKKSECWTCVAMYYDMKGRRDAAYEHGARAFGLNNRSAMACIAKGDVLLGSGELFRAVGEYRLAWSIQKSVVAAECLFDGLIMQSDRAKALTVAQEALKLAGPENPRVLTLMGRALSSDPGTVDQATKYFEKALALEPKCLEAIIALAAFYRGAEKIDKAVDLLEKSIEKMKSDRLYVAFGDLMYISDKMNEASAQYTAALTVNRYNSGAQMGLKRIERALQGAEEEVLSGEDEGEVEPDEEWESDDAT